jgi:hypothetical protein
LVAVTVNRYETPKASPETEQLVAAGAPVEVQVRDEFPSAVTV